MALPLPVERLWDELQSARAELLREAEGLSQRQADWKPSERDWSVGEIVDHLTLAEVGTGKLTTKLLKERRPAPPPFPPDLNEFAPVPRGAGRTRRGAARRLAGARQVDRRAGRDHEGRRASGAASRSSGSRSAIRAASPSSTSGSARWTSPSGGGCR